jgi:hypothetical protein
MAESGDEIVHLPGNEEQLAAMRGDIAETRAQMSETVDALQRQLSPGALKEQATAAIREQANLQQLTAKAQRLLQQVDWQQVQERAPAIIVTASTLVGAITVIRLIRRRLRCAP